MRFMKYFLLAFVLTVGFSSFAKADYFVWQDVHTGVSFSYPDTWKIVTNTDPDDIVTVMAPAGRGVASCRIRNRDDDRFVIFPSHLDWAKQKTAYSFEFWNAYLGEYDDHDILMLRDGSGLGRGYAGYVEAAYNSTVKGPYMQRRALALAAIYNGETYILECSAHKDAFNNWKDMFLSIAGSVDFKPTHHQLRSGNYRTFMHDPRMVFDTEDGAKGAQRY